MQHYVTRIWVLVTGGTGLLGSHLCDKPLEQDSRVLSAINLHTVTKRKSYHAN